MVKVEIDGTTYEAEEGATILDIANDNNIDIPTLCHNKALGAYGSCRLCIVEIQNRKGSQLVASCTYPVSDGLKIQTNSEKVHKSRKLTI